MTSAELDPSEVETGVSPARVYADILGDALSP